jgi:hypothetical protein
MRLLAACALSTSEGNSFGRLSDVTVNRTKLKALIDLGLGNLEQSG